MHLVNQMEIQVGKLAQEKGQSEQVRQFGQRLAQAHRDVDQEVRSLARRQGIELPKAEPGAASSGGAWPSSMLPGTSTPQTAALDREQSAELERHYREQRELLERLQKVQGQDFDREFAEAMVDGHRKTIGRLNDAKNDATNPEVRDLVDRTLPILESHQRDAEQLKSSAS
jgi:putative membrane protein